MYQNSLTGETRVSLFKQSDVVLARLQEVEWQQTMSLHSWCLHNSSYVNKQIYNIKTQQSINLRTQKLSTAGTLNKLALNMLQGTAMVRQSFN